MLYSVDCYYYVGSDGKDIANVLGYQNGSQDINRHVGNDDKDEVTIHDATEWERIVANIAALQSSFNAAY